MKKRFFAAAVSVATAAVMCFALASCGDPKAADVKSEKIETKEAWEAAFAEENFENYKAYMTMSTSTETTKEDGSTEKGSRTVSLTGSVADKKEYLKGKAKFEGSMMKHYKKEATMEAYGDLTGTEAVMYMKEDDEKWYTSPSMDEGVDFNEYTSLYYIFGGLYESFEYNDEAQGYVFKGMGVLVSQYKGYTLKFKDGKFVGFCSTTEAERTGSKATTTIDMYLEYGGQSVEIPQSVIDEANAN